MKSDGKQRTPLPLLVTFAVFGFAATLLLNLLPPTIVLSKALVYTVCPACPLTATVDPSFASVALILAPLDGAVFGALGGLLGAILNIVRR